MISTILTAIKVAGSFVAKLMTDYISNIIVTTLIFPMQVLKESKTTYNNLVKPLVINF